MIRSLGGYIALEIFGLWLVEAILCAVFLYCFFSNPFISGESLPIQPLVCGKAIFYAMSVSLFCVAVGFYRADVCFRFNKWSFTAVIMALCLTLLVAIMRNVIGPLLNLADNGRALLHAASGWIACVAVTRIAFLLAHQSELFARKVLVVGSSQSARRIQNMINSNRGELCQFVGNVVLSACRSTKPVSSAFDINELRRQKIWGVVLAKDAATLGAREDLLAHVMSLKQFRRAHVFDEAGFCENRLQRLDPHLLPQEWQCVLAKMTDQNRVNLAYRATDIVISAALLMLTLPLFALLALAIRIESSGPIFYSETRVGQHSRHFRLHRFRTHFARSAYVARSVWAVDTASQGRQGATKIGRFMRSFHIDGLPQLLNVISGEMSLIGPRPEPPCDAERFSKLIPHYSDRACLKPGLIGWAQIKFPCSMTVEDARMSLAYDLFYIKHRSVVLQLMIALVTLRIMLFSKAPDLRLRS